MGVITVNVAGSPVAVADDDSYEVDAPTAQSGAGSASFTVIDTAGTTHYTKGQPVNVVDATLGTQFNGYVQTATETSWPPSTLLETQTTAIDNHWLADKRTYEGQEFTNTFAGPIVAQVLSSTLAAEGVTAAYASRYDDTQAQFAQGTLSGVTATTNSGGDLELSLAGSTVTILEDLTADFSSGSLINVTAASNVLAPTATSAIKLVAKCSQPNSADAYTYVKFWTGSHVVGATDVFSYDLWIDPSSPNGMMGIDMVFSDNTSLRNTGAFLDAQGLGPNMNVAQNDAGPMAIGHWFHRSFDFSQFSGKTISYLTLVSGGNAVGTYTCWVKNVQMNNTFFAFPQNTTQQLQNNGYSSAIISTVNTYDLTNNPYSLEYGTTYGPTTYRQSNAKNISAAVLSGTTSVNWNVTQPIGTLFQLFISYDNGGSFWPCSNNAPLPNLPAGTTVSGMTQCLLLEQFVYDPSVSAGTANPEQLLQLNAVSITVNPAYNATKSDVTYSVTSNAAWQAGTFSTTGGVNQLSNFAGKDLTLNGHVRNWDNGDISGQSVFGASVAEQVIRQNHTFFIASLSAAVSQLSFAGTIANGTTECDMLIDNTLGKMGMTWRTTSFNNTDGTYAYSSEITGGQLKMLRGSNGGGNSVTTLQTVTLNLNFTSDNWHRMKVVFNGSTHQIYLDDVLYITQTDSTYTAAGYIGLRCSNSTGGAYTSYFDNFGVAPSLTGTWLSGNQSLAAVGTYGNSVVSWRDISTDPGNTDTVLVESSVDGSTFQTCTNGSPVPNLTLGQSLSAVNLRLRVTLTTTTITTMPGIDFLVAKVIGQFNSSGNRISPALSLAAVTGGLSSSLIAWNATLPSGCTLGVDTRIDSGSFTDQTAQNGGTIAGLTVQAAVTDDLFTANTSANYTSTFATGGAAVTSATFDTTNKRLLLTGGTNALYISTAPTGVGDVDFLWDMDESDSGGGVWHFIDGNNYYDLVVSDSLSSNGTQNSITMFRTLSGVRTQVAQVTSLSFTRGQWRRYRVIMRGAVITVSVDGVQQISFTDGTPVGAGKCGFRNTGAGTISRYYQLRIQPLGQDVTAHSVQYRLRLASTNPLATPQVTSATQSAFGPSIQAGINIPKTTLYQNYVSKGLDDLAKLCNYWWYIDANKVLYFLPTNGLPAPWVASDNPGDFLHPGTSNPITVEDSSDLYRNRQIITGVLQTVAINENRVGDGKTTSWTFGNEWASAPTITITTLAGVVTTATVGVKNVDTGKQFYYAVGDPTITEDSTGPVYDFTFSLNFAGTGQFTTFAQADNVSQQTARAAIDGTSGIIENVEAAPSNMTYAQGLQLAQSRLAQFGVIGRLLKATTRRPGLSTGQLLSVFLPEHNLWNTQMLIRLVRTHVTTEKIGASLGQQGWYYIEATSGADIGDWTRNFINT